MMESRLLTICTATFTSSSSMSNVSDTLKVSKMGQTDWITKSRVAVMEASVFSSFLIEARMELKTLKQLTQSRVLFFYFFCTIVISRRSRVKVLLMMIDRLSIESSLMCLVMIERMISQVRPIFPIEMLSVNLSRRLGLK